MLLEQDATRDKIRAGFEALKDQCDANSTVFLYFSGQGGQSKDRRIEGNILCPSKPLISVMTNWHARQSRVLS